MPGGSEHAHTGSPRAQRTFPSAVSRRTSRSSFSEEAEPPPPPDPSTSSSISAALRAASAAALNSPSIPNPDDDDPPRPSSEVHPLSTPRRSSFPRWYTSNRLSASSDTPKTTHAHTDPSPPALTTTLNVHHTAPASKAKASEPPPPPLDTPPNETDETHAEKPDTNRKRTSANAVEHASSNNGDLQLAEMLMEMKSSQEESMGHDANIAAADADDASAFDGVEQNTNNKNGEYRKSNGYAGNQISVKARAPEKDHFGMCYEALQRAHAEAGRQSEVQPKFPAIHKHKGRRMPRKRRKSGQWSGPPAPAADHLGAVRNQLNAQSLRKLGNFLCKQRAKQWALREFFDSLPLPDQQQQRHSDDLHDFLCHTAASGNGASRLPRACLALLRSEQRSVSAHSRTLNGDSFALHQVNNCFRKRSRNEATTKSDSEDEKPQRKRPRMRGLTKRLLRDHGVGAQAVSKKLQDSESLSAYIGRRCVAIHPQSGAPRRGQALSLAEQSTQLLVQFEDPCAGVEPVSIDDIALSPDDCKRSYARRDSFQEHLTELRPPPQLIRCAALLDKKERVVHELGSMNAAAEKTHEIGEDVSVEMKKQYSQLLLELQNLDQMLDRGLRDLRASDMITAQQTLATSIKEGSELAPLLRALAGSLLAVCEPNIGSGRARAIGKVIRAAVPEGAVSSERLDEAEHLLQRLESAIG